MIDHSPEEAAALEAMDRRHRRRRHWRALWAAVMWSGQTLLLMIFVSWGNLGPVGMQRESGGGGGAAIMAAGGGR
jgi:hypothetical protein